MIELFEQEQITIDRQSSKGNQLKWKRGSTWYKADYAGYEGLSEYVVSRLLERSSLDPGEYALYSLEKIQYKTNTFNAVSSADISGGKQMITLERLFSNMYGTSLTKMIYGIHDHKKRFVTMIEQVKNLTGLDDFGVYLSKMLTIDSFFLNEDRHSNNIAVLVDGNNQYDYCPIFDNGAALFSDTTMDYPVSKDVFSIIDKPKSKTFCQSFEEQADIAEEIYGEVVHFYFTKKEVRELINSTDNYSNEIKARVEEVIYQQMRKYSYLFR